MPEVTKPVPIDESSDVVHDDTTGGTDGNPHTLSAELDDTGVLRAGQLPDLAVTNTSTVTAQSDLTGLDAEQGDVGIVTDDSQAYILTTDDPTALGNWVVIKSPPAPVDDVFGRTGSVSPQSGDYSASEIANFAATALSAINAEINATATSVAGLDDATNSHIGASNPHAGSADTNHGNEAHSESYITSAEAPVQSVNGETGDVTAGDTTSDAVRVKLDGSQTLDANTLTKLDLGEITYDTGNNFDTGTNSYTCPKDGVYAAQLSVLFFQSSNSTADDQRRVVIGTENDATPIGEGTHVSAGGTSDRCQLQVSSFSLKQAGDTIAFYAENEDADDSVGSGVDDVGDFTHAEIVYIGNP